MVLVMCVYFSMATCIKVQEYGLMNQSRSEEQCKKAMKANQELYPRTSGKEFMCLVRS